MGLDGSAEGVDENKSSRAITEHYQLGGAGQNKKARRLAGLHSALRISH